MYPVTGIYIGTGPRGALVLVLCSVLWYSELMFDVLAPVRAVLRSGTGDELAPAPAPALAPEQGSAQPWTLHKGALSLVQVLRETGEVPLALEASQVPRTTAYRWKREDKEFDAAWEEARSYHTSSVLVRECIRRATVGDLVLRKHRDGTTTEEWRKSDLLLMFIIKARDPTYRDSFKVEHEITGPALLVGPRPHKGTSELEPAAPALPAPSNGDGGEGVGS